MARVPRKAIDDGWVHVTNRGARRLPIFGDDADHEGFLDAVGVSKPADDLDVHAYALMPNHFHLLVNGSVTALSDLMQRLCGRYTQRFNTKYGLDGALFRGRYHAAPIDSEQHLERAVRYIHRNPVGTVNARGLAVFRWTSHLAYLGLVRAPAWLAVEDVLARFGGDRDGYRRFVEGADTEGADVALAPRPQVAGPVDIERALGLDSPSERAMVRSGGRGVRNKVRLACVLLCAEWTPATADQLAPRFGFSSASGVRSAVSSARALVHSDAAFRSLVEAAEHRLAAGFGRGSDPSVPTRRVGESAA